MTRGLGEERTGATQASVPHEQLGPLLAGAGGEAGGDRLAQFVPAGQVELVRGLLGQAQDAGELGVEAGLQGAHGHVAAVGGGVAAVEGAPPSRRLLRRRSCQTPAPNMAWIIVVRWAVPSTMAASTTWPVPWARAWWRAARTPVTR